VVTDSYGVGLEMIVLFDNCAVGCGSGTDCVGWSICCRLCFWNGLCWKLTLLYGVVLERIVLDVNCAVGSGSGTDFDGC
jgi:hypothetical protein